MLLQRRMTARLIETNPNEDIMSFTDQTAEPQALDSAIADTRNDIPTDDVMRDFDFSAPKPKTTPAPAEKITTPATIDGVPAVAEVATPAALDKERKEFYATMSKQDAKELQAAAQDINQRFRRVEKAHLEIGQELLKIKMSKVGYFDKWLKVEFQTSRTSAWDCIKLAQRLGDSPEVVEALPFYVSRRLVADATPIDVLETVKERIKSGENVPVKQVQGLIEDGRARKRADEEAEREQRKAEAVKQEKNAAWKVEEVKLQAAGKSATEVKQARKVWNDEAERKEREKQERAAKAKAASDSIQESLNAKKQAAKKAANFLKAELGLKYEDFRQMLADADLIEFRNIVAGDLKEQPKPATRIEHGMI